MRIQVPLEQAYTLINHGPTTLISSYCAGRVNVMASAWITWAERVPARLAIVLARETFTRELVEATGEFVVNLPTIGMAQAVMICGKHNGRVVDKVKLAGLTLGAAERVGAPLIEGCVAWIECMSLGWPSSLMAGTLLDGCDLVLASVRQAWVDDRVWDGGWRFEEHPELRTIHHLARGTFLATGERLVVPQL